MPEAYIEMEFNLRINESGAGWQFRLNIRYYKYTSKYWKNLAKVLISDQLDKIVDICMPYEA